MYIMLSKRETRLLILMTETFQSTVLLYYFTVLFYLYFEMCLTNDVFAFG